MTETEGLVSAQDGTGAREAQVCRGVYSPVTLGMPCRRGTGKATTKPRLVPTISKPWQTSRLVTDRRWGPGWREGSGGGLGSCAALGAGTRCPARKHHRPPARALAVPSTPSQGSPTTCCAHFHRRERPGARLPSWGPCKRSRHAFQETGALPRPGWMSPPAPDSTTQPQQVTS